MDIIKSYVTDPASLNTTFLNYNTEVGKRLSANVKLIVHSKEVYEPTISPIIGGGLPSLQAEEMDKLRSNLETYVRNRDNISFQLSQDIFSDIFSNVDTAANLILHTFSNTEVDFVLHNIYNNNELDSAFDNLSPALFIPKAYKYITPKNFYIFLFSENLGSNFKPIIDIASTLGSKINFIIQQVEKDRRDESILEKITKANNLSLKDINFSAKFVDKLDEKMIDDINSNSEEAKWNVFQHSFLLKDLKDKTLDIDIYNLLTESEHPILIV